MQKFTPKQYLQIDIANLYGKDKLTWNERLAWFEENQDKLLDLAPTADAPAQYYAAVKNYFRVCDGGINHHPIALDATSSGTQILACLTCDPLAAKYCNIINVGKRVDAYTDLFNLFKELVPEAEKSTLSVTRDEVKDAVMVSLYGSTKKPQELFGKYINEFYTLMERECPLIWGLNRYLSSSWNPKVTDYGWVMPDNFHVHIKVHNLVNKDFMFNGMVHTVQVKEHAPTSYGKAYSANVAHSIDSLIVREITALAMHNPKRIKEVKAILEGIEVKTEIPNADEMVNTLVRLYRQTGFMSARILEYITNSNVKTIPQNQLKELLALVPAKPFQILCIHDSFKVLPNYGNDLRELYVAQLAKIAKSTLLQHILNSLPIPRVQVMKGDPAMWRKILDAEYALS